MHQKVTLDEVSYLELLIEAFLEEFVLLYPDRPLTPKMHYLVTTHSYVDKEVINLTIMLYYFFNILSINW